MPKARRVCVPMTEGNVFSALLCEFLSGNKEAEKRNEFRRKPRFTRLDPAANQLAKTLEQTALAPFSAEAINKVMFRYVLSIIPPRLIVECETNNVPM